MALQTSDGSLSVRAKLGLLVLIACIGLLALGGGGLLALMHQQEKLEQTLATQATTSRALVDVEGAHARFKTQVQEWKNILLRGNDPAQFDKYLKQFDEEGGKVQAALGEAAQEFARLGLDGGELKALQNAHATLGVDYRQALASFDKGDPQAGQKVDKLVKGKDRATSEGLDKLVKKIEAVAAERAAAAVDAAAQDYRINRNLFALAFLAATVLLGAFATVILRALFKQLGGEPADAVQAVQRIAGGDLSAGNRILDQAREGILLALAQMRQRLSRLISDLHASEQSLSASASQLNERAGRAVATAERQSGTASAIAAASEELAASIASAAENAQLVEQKAADSGRLAAEGVAVVNAAVASLRSIAVTVQETAGQVDALGMQSGEITQIVQVIREIADQTNLLALNAAIEAARAGESGRGFAVVADEVRKLAERTTTSTSQIADMVAKIQDGTNDVTRGIGHAVGRVSEAAAFGEEAGLSISRIQASTTEVVIAVRDIALALTEQNIASQSIAGHAEAIAQEAEGVTQRASQNAAEAQSLVALSEQMKGAVTAFRY